MFVTAYSNSRTLLILFNLQSFLFRFIYQMFSTIPWSVTVPSQGQYLHKKMQNQKEITDLYPCSERDSNPRFEYSSGPSSRTP